MFFITTDLGSKIPGMAFPRERVSVLAKLHTDSRCSILLACAYIFLLFEAHAQSSTRLYVIYHRFF
jgi:hypothetical protein